MNRKQEIMEHQEKGIRIFDNKEFGNVRVIEKSGQPWFVGKDVAMCLGFKNTRDAIINHVFEEDKDVEQIDTLGGKQIMTIINEVGMYGLILGSQLPSAKKFKKWVTSEVLPSIRKIGMYSVGNVSNQAIEILRNEMVEVVVTTVNQIVGAKIDEIEKKCAELYRPSSKEKIKMYKYIKARMAPNMTPQEYDMIKQRVLLKLGGTKWEDIPVEVLINSLDIVDASIKIIKSDRPVQMTIFDIKS